MPLPKMCNKISNKTCVLFIKKDISTFIVRYVHITYSLMPILDVQLMLRIVVQHRSIIFIKNSRSV